ncbi:MAG: alpha-2-macroglobulin, partial [Phaeodactylibacter sp.]|nr:alpha-2-macroglobulin [Phaeodactylibacter sp.]
TVTVSGQATAFAGSAVDGAEVKYRVVREVNFPWWPWWRYSRPAYGSGQSQEIASGSLITDSEGKFDISFPAMPDRSVDIKDKPEFLFTVYIDVADITGETHSAQKSVRLAYMGLKADVMVPEHIGRDGGLAHIRITTQNLDGQPVAAQGTVVVHRLDAPQRIYVDRYWAKPDRFLMQQAQFERTFQHYAYSNQDDPASWPQAQEVLNQPFQTPKDDTLFVNPSGWPVGHYTLTLKTQDDKGNAVEVKKFFKVYDAGQRLLPEGTLAWKHQQKEGPYTPGDEASILLATSSNGLNVLYELERRMETSGRKWLKVQPWDKAVHKVEEADKGNVFAHLSFVKYNRAFSWVEYISVPWSDKELKIEYSTFRDKLSPGQEETWQLKVSGPNNEKVAAEMVATLYDASLDAFRPNDWGFSPFPYNYPVRSWNPAHFGSASLFGFYYYYPQTGEGPQRSYRSLNWFNFYLYVNRYRDGNVLMRANARIADSAMAAEPPAYALEEADMAKKAEAPAPPPPPAEAEAAGQQPVEEPAPPVRTNLKETVFFFPELRTDESGNILIRFTMNEALTRWKFLAMAHTRELQYAVSQNQTVTQKELMVLPNPPRFFREGDEIEYTAKVSNLTDKPMKGSAQLMLFDALSMQPVDALLGNTDNTVTFEAAAGQSARLAWRLRIPVGKVMAVTHRVVAKAGSFSDGEESALPVLTNRTLVTESMPLPLKGGETKTFTFSAMEKAGKSSTLQHHSFTLEMTSNPAWYAVKALPYLMEFPYECSEQVFSRYYANTLAASVANSSPAIKAVFERWQNLEPEALVSQLEKNEELKAVLLEETPWVRQAQSETEQRQRIALLFDLNRMAYEQDKAMGKLSEMQMPSGGFPWFPGGRENWYITQYILAGMGHLRALGVNDIQAGSKAWDITARAAGFTDREMAEFFEELQRQVRAEKGDLDKDHLSGIAIHYLYARSLFPELPVEGKAKEAWDYFLGQGKKYWLQKGLYEQAMLAVVMQRTDNAETAGRIVRSLRERALYNDELGMYWKYNTGYFWYEAPIETHAMMIEVFSEVAKDDNAVEQLKIWLLKNKQTNHWKTTKATADAVYALLRYGDNWLEGAQLAQVSFPGLPKDAYQPQMKEATAAAEAGTGYFKASWQGEKVSAGFEKVKVSNPNKGIAWGAAYWQYFEDLDKVDIFRETPLTMVRQLYKEVPGDKGPELRPVGAANPLHPGDKLVVRIELRVDRDMEYVHMKDMRASGLEPINVFSQYKWQGGLGYYESTRDAATHFFFHYLPKGTYVFEYPLRVVHKGDFSNGISSIQCMYAPEFTSHSEGLRIQVR